MPPRKPRSKTSATWGTPRTTGVAEGTHYAVGIDPGFGEAGIVLRCGHVVLEFGLVRDHYGPTHPTALRAQAIAARLVGRLLKWVEVHQIADLSAAVELPVYTSNADGFGKQYATVQAIEAALLEHVAPLLDRFWLAEPHPGESKKAATGNGAAKKQDILDASPLKGSRLVAGLEIGSLHTLADAWAHSLTVDTCERLWNGKISWPSAREEVKFE